MQDIILNKAIFIDVVEHVYRPVTEQTQTLTAERSAHFSML